MLATLTIFLDLDDVLADFVGSALAIHGRTWQELERARIPGTWSIVEPLQLSTEEFWRPITEAGAEFWQSLPLKEGAGQLTSFLEYYKLDWYVLTSPSMCPSSYVGKLNWCRQMFGYRFDRLIPTRHKHLLAKEGTILIDDNSNNVYKFVESGGSAIIYPTNGNCLFELSDRPIKYVLERLLEEIELWNSSLETLTNPLGS